LSGSLVLGSIPRTVWVLQNASELVTDNRVVVTCCKNNDGELGDRSAWTRDNGLWSPVSGFDWDAFDNPVQPGAKTGSAITEQAMAAVFDHGDKALTKTGRGGRRADEAHRPHKVTLLPGLGPQEGAFKHRLLYDQKTKLYQWNPT